ncbi:MULTISPECIES: hypothetical protein [unclassified Pseudovibrio]|uniref:hypothetical protein n=1 Tax=unclassified Pseudovibrio TaxID=2627060 RepID=UPI0007AE7286|nr:MULTISPECIES: hypothetical protein [unclassified Pseudovibrio]KZK97292.1 hypothetical protein PsW74_03732 [Pseudovibrio sp. W74]KZL08978.1 hypothetical protein PsAD14_02557 [Pseudovibrio sp. Ad14]
MPKRGQQTTTKQIEVFRPGTFTSMGGTSFSITGDELSALAKRYDANANPVPVVVGHPKTNDPAYGWVQSFSYDDAAERLIAKVGELDPDFSEAVETGRYKKISMSFFQPGASSNPAGDELYPRHVGFLGGAAPAVSGLKPVEFAEGDDDTLTIEFGDRAFKDVASVFRRIRDFFIEEHGLETADRVISDWEISWIDDAGTTPEPVTDDFSNPPVKDDPVPNPKTPQSAEFAAREATLQAREDELNKRESEARHKEHGDFAEDLINEGRLATSHKPRVVALLDGLAGNYAGSVDFADGDTTKTQDLLGLTKDLFKVQPKIVEFGETDLSDPPADGTTDTETIAREAVEFQAGQREAGIEVSTSDAVLHVRKKHGFAV